MPSIFCNNDHFYSYFSKNEDVFTRKRCRLRKSLLLYCLLCILNARREIACKPQDFLLQPVSKQGRSGLAGITVFIVIITVK